MLINACQISGRKPNESASLKIDGTRILICCPQEKPGKNVAILDDKLTVLIEFPATDNLAVVRTAVALPTFDKFLVLSDDGKNGQIRLTDAAGATLKKSALITDFSYSLTSSSLTQTSLSADGKYFALNYTSSTNAGINMLRIFETETLTELANRPLVGTATAAQSFVLSTSSGWGKTSVKVYYWALNAIISDGKGAGINQMEFYRLDSALVQTPLGAVAPSTNNWKIQRILEKKVFPGLRFSVNVNENKALFATSATVDKKEQISFFEYTPSSDCKEGRIETLLTEEHDPETVKLVVSPDGKYLFYSQKLADNHTNFAWSIMRLSRESGKIKLVPMTLTKLSKGMATSVSFSGDCKTLLVGCSTLNLFKLNLA